MKILNTFIALTVLTTLTVSETGSIFAQGLNTSALDKSSIDRERARGFSIIDQRNGWLNNELTNLSKYSHNTQGNDYAKSELSRLAYDRTRIDNHDLRYNELQPIVQSLFQDYRIHNLVLPEFDQVIVPASGYMDALTPYFSRACGTNWNCSTYKSKDYSYELSRLLNDWGEKKFSSDKRQNDSIYLGQLRIFNKTIAGPLKDLYARNAKAIDEVRAITPQEYNVDPQGALDHVKKVQDEITFINSPSSLATISAAQDSFDATLESYDHR